MKRAVGAIKPFLNAIGASLRLRFKERPDACRALQEHLALLEDPEHFSDQRVADDVGVAEPDDGDARDPFEPLGHVAEAR
jgi:hypothetical protein